MAKGIRFNGGFKMLAPAPVGNWDPSQKGMPVKPTVPHHRTVTQGVIMADNGAVTNGMMTGTSFAKATGTFEVVDNTFADPVELVIGDYRIFNSVDYAVGVAAANTATNIAAVISKLPGFSATAALAVVTVLCDHQADDTDFRALHHGTTLTLSNFTGSGYLTKGVPYAGPPVLT
jgi:hypothetical protein